MAMAADFPAAESLLRNLSIFMLGLRLSHAIIMCVIRKIEPEEIPLLWDFLYEAVYVPEGMPVPDRNIVELPELKIYVDGFGEKYGDICLVAECGGHVAGAIWTRIIDDFGHVEDSMPSLALSVLDGYRRRGLGGRLLASMLELLREEGFVGVSLSVQKDNFAAGMYLRYGFSIVRESSDEYVMVHRFR